MGARLLLLEGDILASSEAALAPESSAGKAPTPDPTPPLDDKMLIFYIIFAAVGGAILLFLFLSWLIRRSLQADSEDDENFLENLSGVPSRFTYEELKQLTGNFQTSLGEGGFGSVFAGKLPGGFKIAVKRLNRQIGSLDFRAEVATVGCAHHVNLVQLRGFCAQGPHRLLVYEFMPNSSLDKWLFRGGEVGGSGQAATTILDWSQRFNIALGTARGLAYLHYDCNKRIIHCDIKPQNILLDKNLVPKVSDFGLSKSLRRSFGADMSNNNVPNARIQGTYEYMAPEQCRGKAVSESDVYSYGLVLFELMRGRKNTDGGDYFPSTCLQKVSEQGFEQSTLAELVDPQLHGSFDEEQLKRVLHVAICCIQEAASARPNMRNVVLILEGNVPLWTIDLTSMEFPWSIQQTEIGPSQRQAGADSNGVTGASVEYATSSSLTSGEIISADVANQSVTVIMH